MADILSRHHGGDWSEEPPRHFVIVSSDCESVAPPKGRQNSKSLTEYQHFNKLGKCIPI